MLLRLEKCGIARTNEEGESEALLIPKELADKYGIKRTEILFTNSPKVMIRYSDWVMEERIIENATSINVEQTPEFTALNVIYKTEDGNGAVISSVEHIKEIIVMNG